MHHGSDRERHGRQVASKGAGGWVLPAPFFCSRQRLRWRAETKARQPATVQQPTECRQRSTDCFVASHARPPGGFPRSTRGTTYYGLDPRAGEPAARPARSSHGRTAKCHKQQQPYSARGLRQAPPLPPPRFRPSGRPYLRAPPSLQNPQRGRPLPGGTRENHGPRFSLSTRPTTPTCAPNAHRPLAAECA